MAHVHLEDGAFDIVSVLIWSAAAAGVIALALWRLKGARLQTHKLAIGSMAAAVAFAASQIEIPVFGGLHLNLTPLIGILVGPSLGTLCVLVINVFGAAIGHGGWGMIGANTLVNVVEVTLGFYAYLLLRKALKLSRFASGFGAATIALTVSAFVAVAIVALSGIQGSTQTKAEILGNMMVFAFANIATGIFEGVVTGYIVKFLGRVRPDLLGDPIDASQKEHRAEVSADV